METEEATRNGAANVEPEEEIIDATSTEPPEPGPRSELRAALAKVRDQMLASAPEVPEELVTGETLEELEATFKGAKEMVERLLANRDARLAAVGGGAPGRTPPPAGTPFERIREGLAKLP